MKNISLSATAILAVVCAFSPPVFADGMDSMNMDNSNSDTNHSKINDQQELQDQCNAIAQQHQVAADKMKAWIQKCVNQATWAKQNSNDKSQNNNNQ